MNFNPYYYDCNSIFLGLLALLAFSLVGRF